MGNSTGDAGGLLVSAMLVAEPPLALDDYYLDERFVRKPLLCLEYIVVREMVHLLERRHGERFVGLMDEHLPHWRECHDELNAAPLAHEKWEY